MLFSRLLLFFCAAVAVFISNPSSLFGQTATVFQDDFEPASGSWTLGSVGSENQWHIGTCAGNGGTFAGDSALYVSNGNTVACGLDYNMMAAASSSVIIASHTVNASCVSGNLNVKLDYKSNLNTGSTLEIVYSTDGGSTWTSVTTLSNQSAWFSSSSISLPLALAGTSFELGFRFTYDNSPVGSAIPPAIDNVIVTGDDTTPPILICPTSDTIQSDPIVCEVGLGKMNSSVFSVSDNCTASSNISFSQTPPETYMLHGHLDNVMVTLTAEDEAGNQSSCNINVVMVDLTPPTPTCPPDTTQILAVNCATSLADFTTYVLSNSTDNCGLGTASQSPVPGTALSGDGTVQAVTISLVDAAGNSNTCSFNVALIDSTAPTLSCPSSAPMYVNNMCTGVVPDYTNYIANNFAHDSCSAPGTMTATQDIVAGTFLSSNQLITYTVKDAHGNASTCQVMLVLTDTINPQITCQASSYALNPVSNCSAPLPDYTTLYPPVTSDNCGGSISVHQNPAPGTVVSGVNNYVYLVATDASGNQDSCSFVVNINDTSDPIIVCPNDTVIASDQYCQGSLIDFRYLASMSDNCADTFTLSQNFSQSPAVGTLMTGTVPITVTLTALDNSGNSSNCTLQVGLVDLTPPTIDPIPSFVGVTNPSSCDYTLPDYASTASAHDNCTPDGSITLWQNPAAGTTLIGTGAHSVDIIAEDLAGNKDTLSINFTVQDNTNPTVSGCPSTQTVYASASCASTLGDFTGSISASDNCTSAGNFTITQSPSPTATISTNTTVTITVADESGNSDNSCSFSVQFVDTIAPQINCISDTSITVNGSCGYNVPDLVSALGANDNCDVSPSLTQSPLAGTASSDTTVVTLTAQDISGNISTCTVNVLPSIPPVTISTCAPNQNLTTTTCSQTIGDYTGSVTVNAPCGGATLTQIPAPGTSLSTGSHQILIVAEDTDNNKDSCYFTLTISENTAPMIICPNDTSSCDPHVIYSAPIGTDNCVAVTTQTDATGLSSGSIFPIGVTTLEYTVSDSSGNTANCTFSITVLDYPDTALTMPDTALCGTNSSIISANAPASGTGQWSVLNSGSATLNNNLSNTTGVNNLQIGDNVFLWTVSSTSCGFKTDTLYIHLDELPNPPASTMDTMQACHDSIVSISANTPNVGFGYWHDPNGNAQFADSSSSNTSVSNLIEGWNEIVWSIGNGVCPLSSDTIHLFSNQIASITTNLDSILPLCLDDNTITVAGVPPVNGFTSLWYIGEGTGDIAFSGASQTMIKNLGVGTNVIMYKLTGIFCDPSADSIVVVVEDCNDLGDNFPTMITPNSDGQNDLWVLDNLNASYPQCTVNIFDQWGNIVYKSTGYATPWDGTYKGKPLPMGTYFYVIETNGSDNQIFKGHISIIH